MLRLSLTVLLLAGVLAGCTDKDKPPFVPDDAGRQRDGGQIFLGACLNDSDCESGRCLQLGASKRCTRACNNSEPCPTLGGWSCGNEAFCVCQGSGKEPNLCNVDGDCDGQPDREIKEETCNNDDDDCNGKVDDVGPQAAGAKPYYPDSDKDGYGDGTKQTWACKLPAGYVEDHFDCDDQRDDVHPGVVEVCGDGIDHDCDDSTWDADVCGSLPPPYADINAPNAASASLKQCGANAALDPSLDFVEIVAKQDPTLIKFTIRVAGSPALTTCSSYVLRLGTFDQVYRWAYIYRPATLACAGLPELEAYLDGQKVSSTGAVGGFNAASPGHVSFTIPKTEYLAALPTPSYYLKICSNAVADAAKDLTDCASDSCETPVRRE